MSKYSSGRRLQVLVDKFSPRNVHEESAPLQHIEQAAERGF